MENTLTPLLCYKGPHRSNSIHPRRRTLDWKHTLCTHTFHFPHDGRGLGFSPFYVLRLPSLFRMASKESSQRVPPGMVPSGGRPNHWWRALEFIPLLRPRVHRKGDRASPPGFGYASERQPTSRTKSRSHIYDQAVELTSRKSGHK